MASVQGYVRYAGAPIGRCFYTAYYKSNNGGSPGPGAGQRASQWLSGVFITEDSGLYSVALSSDVALGAAATVSNGDQVVVLFWRQSAYTPPNPGGTFFSGQSRTDGSGGTHAIGFKANNGTAVNYAACNYIRTAVFTMTGNAWNATPGGIGGSANGDVDLLLNGSPSAALSGASIDVNNPTAVQRNVAVTMNNISADDVTNKLFTFNGQTLLEAMSAAHSPGDATPTDGSLFSFSVGLSYGSSFGVPAGGDANGVNFSSYAGPLFKSHSHTFPGIDVYKVDLTVKDDSVPPLTSAKSYYFKTSYVAPVISISSVRKWCSWAQYTADPQATNPSFSASNPNTVNDVVLFSATVTDPQNVAGSSTTGRKFSSAFTMSGSTYTINQIGVGIGALKFLNIRTQGGVRVRKSFVVVSSTSDSVTIQTAGDATTFSSRDWYDYSTEPAGGTSTSWDWEVNDGTGWTRIGASAGVFAASLTGLSVVSPGIGNNVIPGWYLSVIDGPGRTTVKIVAVTDDDHITVESPVSVNAGDHYEIGCRNQPVAVFPQYRNGTLNVRIIGDYSTGWSHVTALPVVTQNGVVTNIPPQAVVSKSSAAGSSTTYTFDGRKSYGTQTAWVQDSSFILPHSLDGLATFDIADPAINTSGLRDGHAWLTILDASGIIVAVFPIVDLPREYGVQNTVTIATQGSTLMLPAGTRFRTTNVYEIDGGYQDNDISGYGWDLRSADVPSSLPSSHAEFLAMFDRADGTGSGDIWSYTYSQSDVDRWACVELTVIDASGGSNLTWHVFQVTISTPPTPGTARPRRVEWD